MIKRYLFMFMAVFALSGCLGSTCIERATSAKALNVGVVQQANLAFSGELIDLETYEKVDKRTDEANLAIDSALPVCLSDESNAKAILRQTRTFILESQKIMKGEEDE